MKLKLLLFTLLLPTLLFAQDNWAAFSYQVDAKPYLGKRFKVEAAVRTQLVDPLAEAEIWVRVDLPGQKIGFFNNMKDKPIRSATWTTVSIEGKIDKEAVTVVFGGLFGRKGIFDFDNFKFSIETGKGQYEEVAIPNGNFEADSLRPYWHYGQDWNNFHITLNKEGAYEGKQFCRADGSRALKSHAYGDNDSTGHYANVNGITIYYEEYGKGEPLLLLHGNSESIQSFKSQIPEFAKQSRVIAVDTRGQGKSTEDGRMYTYDLFAEDMNALLDHLKIDSANIVGWSDGGNTGLIMAMKYPSKVKSLVTMGANVFIDKSVVEKWVFKELNKQLKELKDDTVQHSRNRVRLINLLLTEPRHRFEELKTISCPVLVVAGEKDVIKEEHTKNIAANIPRSTLLIVPAATHEYPSESPASFNKTVLDFFHLH